MKLKENLDISTDDFFYDLFDGGYLNPERLLEDENDIKKIKDAIETISEFRDLLEENIENFYR